ncbi:MAG: ester cyclase [Polyangiaceae bacterium]
MIRRARGLLLATGLLLSACGAEPDIVPGPKPPPPGTAAPVTAPSATTSAATPIPPERPPLVDLQRAALTKMVAAFAAHDAKAVAALYTPGVVSGSPGPTGWDEEEGARAVEESHKALFAAFPDMKWLSPRAYILGDVAIQEWISNGTHTGDLGSMKASGKPTGMHGISVYVFDQDGLIRKDDTYFDAATIARQTGSLPGPARAVPTLPSPDTTLVTAAAGTPEEAKRADAARAMYAAFAGKDESAFLATLAPEVVHRAYSAPADTTGHKAAAEGYRAMHKAFPDLAVSPSKVWSVGDRVIAAVVTTGTQKGALGPIKPTGKPVTLHSLDVLTFTADGKVATIDSYSSSLELLGQLGAIPDTKTKAKATPSK